MNNNNTIVYGYSKSNESGMWKLVFENIHIVLFHAVYASPNVFFRAWEQKVSQ